MITIASDKWLGAWSAPEYYVNQCWLIVNWIFRYKLQWNLNQNSTIFLEKRVWKCRLRHAGYFDCIQCFRCQSCVCSSYLLSTFQGLKWLHRTPKRMNHVWVTRRVLRTITDTTDLVDWYLNSFLCNLCSKCCIFMNISLSLINTLWPSGAIWWHDTF